MQLSGWMLVLSVLLRAWKARLMRTCILTFTSVIYRIRSKTGLAFGCYFSGPKLCWLLKNHPEVRSVFDKNEAMIGTIDSWVIWNLTGGVNVFLSMTAFIWIGWFTQDRYHQCFSYNALQHSYAEVGPWALWDVRHPHQFIARDLPL